VRDGTSQAARTLLALDRVRRGRRAVDRDWLAFAQAYASKVTYYGPANEPDGL
jgi:hypothetical protein